MLVLSKEESTPHPPLQYSRLGKSQEGKGKWRGPDLWEGPWVTLIPKDKWQSVGSSQTTGLHGEHRVLMKCLPGVLSSWWYLDVDVIIFHLCDLPPLLQARAWATLRTGRVTVTVLCVSFLVCCWELDEWAFQCSRKLDTKHRVFAWLPSHWATSGSSPAQKMGTSLLCFRTSVSLWGVSGM